MALRKVLLSRWSEEYLVSLDVLPTTKTMLLKATLSPKGMPLAARRVLTLSYYLEHHRPQPARA